MIVLTKGDAEIYEAYTETRSITGVTRLTGRTTDAIYKIMQRLTKIGMLKRDRMGRYSPSGESYTVKTKLSKPRPIRKEFLPPRANEDIQDYIRGHYGKLPRRKLAERTGLSKLEVNMTILALGLSKERMEDDVRHAKSNESCSA